MYSPTDWQNQPITMTPVNAQNLNNLEEGVLEAHRLISQLGGTAIQIPSGGAMTMQDRNTPILMKNADVLYAPASVMKVLTAVVAMEHLNPASARLERLTVLASDTNPGGSGTVPFQVGDQITLGNLLYVMMLSSSNWAANLIARWIGQKIQPSASNPIQVFLDRMQTRANDWGYEGAVVDNASGLGYTNQLSVRHVCDLMWRVVDYPILRQIMGTDTRQIPVFRNDDQVIYTVRHTTDRNGVVKFPDMVAAKGGALGNNYATCCMIWEDSSGQYRTAAILSSTQTDRYRDLRTVINATDNYLGNGWIKPPEGGGSDPELREEFETFRGQMNNFRTATNTELASIGNVIDANHEAQSEVNTQVSASIDTIQQTLSGLDDVINSIGEIPDEIASNRRNISALSTKHSRVLMGEQLNLFGDRPLSNHTSAIAVRRAGTTLSVEIESLTVSEEDMQNGMVIFTRMVAGFYQGLGFQASPLLDPNTLQLTEATVALYNNMLVILNAQPGALYTGAILAMAAREVENLTFEEVGDGTDPEISSLINGVEVDRNLFPQRRAKNSAWALANFVASGTGSPTLTGSFNGARITVPGTGSYGLNLLKPTLAVGDKVRMHLKLRANKPGAKVWLRLGDGVDRQVTVGASPAWYSFSGVVGENPSRVGILFKSGEGHVANDWIDVSDVYVSKHDSDLAGSLGPIGYTGDASYPIGAMP